MGYTKTKALMVIAMMIVVTASIALLLRSI